MIFEVGGARPSSRPDRGISRTGGAFGGGETQVSKPVIANGLNHVVRMAGKSASDAGGRNRRFRSTFQLLRKYYLLEACIISCEAIIQWAERHAQKRLGREMAAEENDPKERKSC
jgi:formate C-acetyltransferase